MSALKKKILLALLTGTGFYFAFFPQQKLKILKTAKREWKKINERILKEKIKELYRSKMVARVENPDKSFTLVLTDKGKIRALTYHFQEMKVEKGVWDGKWRIVSFDIPEKQKKGRDALREKLKSLGFYELQKSVLVFPYECQDEIEFIVEFFGLRRFVRYGVLEKIDNDLHLREIFKLI